MVSRYSILPTRTFGKKPKYLNDKVPFDQIKELDISIPVDDFGRIHDFIDSGIAFVLQVDNNYKRGVGALPFATSRYQRTNTTSSIKTKPQVVSAEG
jgi:hypothetical protein